MRGFFTRIVGGLARLDPVEHLGDPDEVPEPDTGPVGRAGMSPPVDAETVRRLREGLRAWDPDGPPVQTVTDVEPERRPWDTPRVQGPPPSPRPLPADRERACIDEDSDRRCDGADAFTSWITAFKALERRVAVLEQQVADEMAKREPKEKQS